ncbi:MAG: metallophosphoesterase [Eubacterium sp.]|nr:metallophosphoesterase [Eubacterium sp.]
MDKTKRLLVISDNHGSEYEIRNILEEFRGKYDALVHCGDSTWSPEYLESLADCPVYMAKGNCDYGFVDREEDVFEFADHICFVTHGHRYGVSWGLNELLEKGQEYSADIIFYGHTHVPDYEEYEEEKVIIMNPGSITLPRQRRPQRTFLIVEFYEDGKIHPQFYTV